MNLAILVFLFAAAFLVFEAVFFLYCFRWLSGAKKQREKEFARIDSERNELIDLQHAVSMDLSLAKKLAEESSAKLQRLGADVHAEWTDMAGKMERLRFELEQQSEKLVETSLQRFQKSKLQLEKVSMDASALQAKLSEKIVSARKILRVFDNEFPLQEIQKGLQEEKYEKAKRMLQEGAEPSAISRSVGISHSEVALLSYMK